VILYVSVCPLFPYTTLFRSFACIEGGLKVCAYLEGLSVAKSRSLGQRVGNRCALSLCDGRRLASIVRKTRCRQWIERPVSTMERSEEHTSELQSRVDLVCRL